MEVITGLTEDQQFLDNSVLVTPFDYPKDATQDDIDKMVIDSFSEFALKNAIVLSYIFRKNDPITEETVLGFNPDDPEIKMKKERKALIERKDELTRFILERKNKEDTEFSRRIDRSPLMALFSRLCCDYYETFKNSHKVFRESIIIPALTKINDAYALAYQCAYYSNKTRKSLDWKLKNLKDADKKLRTIDISLDLSFREKIISYGKHRVLTEEIESVRFALGAWIKFLSEKLPAI